MLKYKTVYSPAMVNDFEIHHELIFVSVIPVVLLFGLVFIYVKYKESKSELMPSHNILLILLPFLFSIYQILTYSERFYKEKSSYLNYENVRGFNMVKEVKGVLVAVNLFERRWPGHTADARGPDYLWKIIEVKTSQSSLYFNTELDWNRSQNMDMPECFTGDLKSLFESFIGYDVKIRYYNFFSNVNPEDKSISTCLVDLKVKPL